MGISSNESIQRKISKAVVHMSLWDNALVYKSLSYLKKHPKLFSGIISPFQIISEGYEMDFFKKEIKPGMTVLDIGANVGIYTLTASALVGDKGKVFAFEPDKLNFKMLEDAVLKHSCKNTFLENIALSNKKGSTKLYIDEVNPGNHSFGQKNLYKGKKAVTIQTIKLDDYLAKNGVKKVDFIKIDVQGAESLVFAGASKLLKQKNIKILMEYWPAGIKNVGQSPEKFLEMFAKAGFKFKVLDKEKKNIYKIKLDDLIADSKKWTDFTDYTNLVLEK